jgi:hypothetical protein
MCCANGKDIGNLHIKLPIESHCTTGKEETSTAAMVARARGTAMGRPARGGRRRGGQHGAGRLRDWADDRDDGGGHEAGWRLSGGMGPGDAWNRADGAGLSRRRG